MFDIYISGLKRSFDFKGRSSRKEYWGFVGINYLVLFLICLIMVIMDYMYPYYYGYYVLLFLICTCVTLVSTTAAAVRRVHDRNLDWYYVLIPYYNIVLMFLPGDKGPNRFGADPYGGSQGNNTSTFQPNHLETGNTYNNYQNSNYQNNNYQNNNYQNNNTGATGQKFCAYCGGSMALSAVFCSRCGKMVQMPAQNNTQSNAGEESGLADQKVVQILKEIFSKYGVEIMREQQRFQSAVLDFLSGQEYREEKIIFRNAIESGALSPFAVPSSVTEETKKAVLSELQQKGHLTEKDAQFVVQCILTAIYM